MVFSKGKPKFCIIKMKTGIKNRVKGILSSLLRQGLHTPRPEAPEAPEAEAGFATEALFFKKNKKEDFFKIYWDTIRNFIKAQPINKQKHIKITKQHQQSANKLLLILNQHDG